MDLVEAVAPPTAAPGPALEDLDQHPLKLTQEQLFLRMDLAEVTAPPLAGRWRNPEGDIFLTSSLKLALEQLFLTME